MTRANDRDLIRWVVDDLAYHQTRVLLLVNAVAANRTTNERSTA